MALRKFGLEFKILKKKMEDEKVKGLAITLFCYSKNILCDMTKVISAKFTPTYSA